MDRLDLEKIRVILEFGLIEYDSSISEKYITDKIAIFTLSNSIGKRSKELLECIEKYADILSKKQQLNELFNDKFNQDYPLINIHKIIRSYDYLIDQEGTTIIVTEKSNPLLFIDTVDYDEDNDQSMAYFDPIFKREFNYELIYNQYKELSKLLDEKFDGNNLITDIKTFADYRDTTFYHYFNKPIDKAELEKINNDINIVKDNTDTGFDWSLRTTEVIKDGKHLIAMMYSRKYIDFERLPKVEYSPNSELSISIYNKDKSPKFKTEITGLEYCESTEDDDYHMLIKCHNMSGLYTDEDRYDLSIRVNNMSTGKQSDIKKIKDINYLYSFTNTTESEVGKLSMELIDRGKELIQISDNLLNSTNIQSDTMYSNYFNLLCLKRDLNHFNKTYDQYVCGLKEIEEMISKLDSMNHIVKSKDVKIPEPIYKIEF